MLSESSTSFSPYYCSLRFSSVYSGAPRIIPLKLCTMSWTKDGQHQLMQMMSLPRDAFIGQQERSCHMVPRRDARLICTTETCSLEYRPHLLRLLRRPHLLRHPRRHLSHPCGRPHRLQRPIGRVTTSFLSHARGRHDR